MWVYKGGHKDFWELKANYDLLTKSLWYMYHVGVMLAYDICPQSYGSCGPSGGEGRHPEPAPRRACKLTRRLRLDGRDAGTGIAKALCSLIVCTWALDELPYQKIGPV